MRKCAFDLLKDKEKSFKNIFSLAIGKVFSNKLEFDELIGSYNKWNVDFETGKLKIDDNEFSVECMATVNAKDDMWYLAELEKNLPDSAVMIQIYVRKLFEQLELNDFTSPKINLENNSDIANKLAIIWTAFYNKEVTYFVEDYNDVNLYMYVKDLPEEIIGSINPTKFVPRAFEIVNNYDVNHKLMIKSFLLNNYCEYEEKDNQIIGIFENKYKIAFQFDGEYLIKCDGIFE